MSINMLIILRNFLLSKMVNYAVGSIDHNRSILEPKFFFSILLLPLKLNANYENGNETVSDSVENSILIFPGYYLANHIQLYNVAKGREKG